MIKNLIQVLQGHTVDVPPIWLMRQAGRYLPEYRDIRAQAGDFLNLCYTPDLASEVTLQPIRRFPKLDGAIIFSDILVVPHALGQKTWFEAGEGPRLEAIQSFDDLSVYDEKIFLTHLNPVFQALERTKEALPEEKTLIGFAGAPWTLACYMIGGRGSRDFQSVRRFSNEKQNDFNKLIDLLVQSISVYLIEKINHGAQAIQIFDSWSGVLSADEFQDYCVEPTRRIVENIKKTYPNIPVIGFPKGAGLGYESYVAQTGINAVSCDDAMPLTIMRDLQKSVCVQGNLSNLLLLHGGQKMKDQAKLICDTLSGGPFVFNLGHGVIKETPYDHVQELIEIVKGQ